MKASKQQTERDRRLGEAAEREVSAQLDVIRVLNPLTGDDRRRILQAVQLLLEADKLVPGIFEAAGRGMSSKVVGMMDPEE